MRRRRDPFARVTYVPYVWRHARPDGCSWCGHRAAPRRPLHQIVAERDDSAHRSGTLSGLFESWSCAEAYHDTKIGR